MEALVIAPQPFYSPRGTPFSVYYRTLVTSEHGVNIDLLTYGEGEDVDIPRVRIIRIPRFSFLGDVKIGPSYLKIFLDIFIFLWTIRLLATKNYDFIHAHEESVFFCRVLKPFFKFKLVYDMHSSLPQQLTNFKFTKSRILINIFRKMEESCLQAADAIITICPDLENYVNGIIGGKKKHFLIENSIFDEILFPSKFTNPCRDASKDTDAKIDLPLGKRFVLYAGTLEAYQGLEILIKAFPFVHQENPEAILLIVGGTKDQVDHYRSLSRECGIEKHVLFTGRVPKSVVQWYSRTASVLVSPRSAGTNTPLKIYEYLSSGKPIVATNIFSHTQVLNPDIAFLVSPDPEGLARGIVEALKPDGKRSRVVLNAGRFYEENYSREVYEGKIRKMLESLA